MDEKSLICRLSRGPELMTSDKSAVRSTTWRSGPWLTVGTLSLLVRQGGSVQSAWPFASISISSYLGVDHAFSADTAWVFTVPL